MENSRVGYERLKRIHKALRIVSCKIIEFVFGKIGKQALSLVSHMS